jgi:hypothetical protein
LELDPQASAPYLCRFEKGTGRHTKDGVRIAVGKVSDARVVALPGPHDEVEACLEILVRGLRSKLGKDALAEEIAEILRARLGGAAVHGHEGDAH